MHRKVLALVAAPWLLTACGSSAARPVSAPSEEPIVSSPLVPLPPPSPLALLAAASGAIASQLSDLPCPPPNLPPELAGRVDCAAMKRFVDATVYAHRDVAAGSLPPVVDLRAHRMVGPVKDQQDIGACAGFAMTSVLDNAARRAGRADVVSPLHMFATYARSGDDFSRVRSRPSRCGHSIRRARVASPRTTWAPSA